MKQIQHSTKLTSILVKGIKVNGAQTILPNTADFLSCSEAFSYVHTLEVVFEWANIFSIFKSWNLEPFM